MPFRLKLLFGDAQLQSIVRPLERSLEKDVLDTVDLAPFSNRALTFLQGIFPKSSRRSHSPSSKNEFGKQLVSGWRARSLVGLVQTRGFELFHVNERNSRVAQILRAVDQGTPAYRYVVNTEDGTGVSFLDRRRKGGKKWTHVAEGDVISHKVRTGEQYSRRTMEYIRLELLPPMQTKIRQTITRALTHA